MFCGKLYHAQNFVEIKHAWQISIYDGWYVFYPNEIMDNHYHRIYNIDSITFAYCIFKVIEDV